MNRICKNCGTNFLISEDDLEFFKRFALTFDNKKFEIPPPTLCHDCRQCRRLAQLNQIHLFKRKCAATHEDIISNFPPESKYTVFSQEYWQSDQFDAEKFGVDYDFNKPFFDQFHELKQKVPIQALYNNYLQDINSRYTNSAGKNKDCYMIFDSDEDWNCYFSYGMNSSRDCVDCYRVQKLELCYEVVDSKDCYGCAFVYNSNNCSDSVFLNNCTGCRNCIYCSNLVDKRYYIFNEKVSKEKFKEIRDSFGSYQFLMEKIPQFHKFRLTFPHKYMRGVQNENVIGNNVVNSKNAYYCFDSMNLWDCRYCYQVFIYAKNCMDIHESGECELNYETANNAYNIYNSLFSLQCVNNCNNIHYCLHCHSCKNCFGCIGLKRKEYCIFNKQYSKEQYEKLVAKIIEQMIETGEWGEFFSIEHSYFEYNLTAAQEYFPLKKEEAGRKGYDWRDPDQKEYVEQTCKLQDNVKDADKKICDETLKCTSCGKNYKIVEPELALYKRMNLPLPRKCFNCRHQDRIKMRTLRRLFDRSCAKCGADIKTGYGPDRPEIVYCEKCWLKAVF